MCRTQLKTKKQGRYSQTFYGSWPGPIICSHPFCIKATFINLGKDTADIWGFCPTAYPRTPLIKTYTIFVNEVLQTVKHVKC